MAFSHTLHYEDSADLFRQVKALYEKLDPTGLEEYHVVRERYRLKPPAFTMRLKRFKGTFPKVMGPKGRKIVRLHVTPELHRALS